MSRRRSKNAAKRVHRNNAMPTLRDAQRLVAAVERSGEVAHCHCGYLRGRSWLACQGPHLALRVVRNRSAEELRYGASPNPVRSVQAKRHEDGAVHVIVEIEEALALQLWDPSPVPWRKRYQSCHWRAGCDFLLTASYLDQICALAQNPAKWPPNCAAEHARRLARKGEYRPKGTDEVGAAGSGSADAQIHGGDGTSNEVDHASEYGGGQLAPSEGTPAPSAASTELGHTGPSGRDSTRSSGADDASQLASAVDGGDSDDGAQPSDGSAEKAGQDAEAGRPSGAEAEASAHAEHRAATQHDTQTPDLGDSHAPSDDPRTPEAKTRDDAKTPPMDSEIGREDVFSLAPDLDPDVPVASPAPSARRPAAGTRPSGRRQRGPLSSQSFFCAEQAQQARLRVDRTAARKIARALTALCQTWTRGVLGEEPSPKVHPQRLVRELVGRSCRLGRVRQETLVRPLVLILVDVSGSCSVACDDFTAAALEVIAAARSHDVALLHHVNGYEHSVRVYAATTREVAQQVEQHLKTHDTLTPDQLHNPFRALRADVAGLVKKTTVAGALALGDTDAVRYYTELQRAGVPVWWLDSFAASSGAKPVPHHGALAEFLRSSMFYAGRPALWWQGVNSPDRIVQALQAGLHTRR